MPYIVDKTAVPPEPDGPPLPEPEGFSAGTYDGALFTTSPRVGKNFAKGAGIDMSKWFTAGQMRAYAAAVVAAERERLAQFCEQRPTLIGVLLADEIRKG